MNTLEQSLLVLNNQPQTKGKLASFERLIQRHVIMGLPEDWVKTENGDYMVPSQVEGGSGIPLLYRCKAPTYISSSGLRAESLGTLFFEPGALSFSRGERVLGELSGALRSLMVQHGGVSFGTQHDYSALCAHYLDEWRSKALAPQPKTESLTPFG
ncbi:hypothetical protein AB6D11_00820 [Vibrio splendidus]